MMAASEFSNSGPGYRQKPDHKVELKPGPARVRIVFNGETIADTSRAITVAETNYQPVHYIPITDVRMDLLKPSQHETYCPFKGTARYWSIETGSERAENAVWGYPAPYDEVSILRDYLAFYPDRGAQILVD